MDKEKFILQEEIKRIKELAGYDKSKTLMEQTAADLNMDRINRAQLDTAPVETTNDDTWIDQVYSKVPNSYLYKKMTYSNLPALQYDGNPNSTIIYTQNRWFQYPKGVTNGTPAIKGSWKLDGNTINAVKDAEYNKPATTQKSSTITDKTVTDSLTFDYTYPGDKNYVYAKKDNVWYAKNKTNNKVFNVSQNYPSTAQNLDKGAVKGDAQSATPTTSATTTTNTTTTQSDVSGEAPEQPVQGAPQVNLAGINASNLSYIGKKITDMNNIELAIYKQKAPLMFDTAYKKLGAIEKKQIDDKLMGKTRYTV